MTPHEKMVEIYPDKELLSIAGTRRVLELANLAISEKGFLTIALAGGSTPKRMYELLASEEFKDKTDWSKWHVFMGDERLVPYDSPDSNYGMAKAILLDNVSIPPENIYPINTKLGNIAAEDYENTIKAAYSKLGITGLDIILLGLGSDGHTLSIFPGKPAVKEVEKLVVATEHGILPPPVDRITLTRVIVDAAKLALFLVAGADKTQVTQQILEQEMSFERPASLIVPTNTLSVCWMLDQAASAGLTK